METKTTSIRVVFRGHIKNDPLREIVLVDTENNIPSCFTEDYYLACLCPHALKVWELATELDALDVEINGVRKLRFAR